jgi:hypothetical protein
MQYDAGSPALWSELVGTSHMYIVLGSWSSVRAGLFILVRSTDRRNPYVGKLRYLLAWWTT